MAATSQHTQRIAQIAELPESVKKEDLKQLRALLPNASECYISSLLPISGDIFASEEQRSSELYKMPPVALCQCLKQFFDQSVSLNSKGQVVGGQSSDNTVIIDTQLTVPGQHT